MWFLQVGWVVVGPDRHKALSLQVEWSLARTGTRRCPYRLSGGEVVLADKMMGINVEYNSYIEILCRRDV